MPRGRVKALPPAVIEDEEFSPKLKLKADRTRPLIPKSKKEWPAFIEECGGIGLNSSQIAALLGCDESEISEQYAKDMKRGDAIAAWVMAKGAYDAAISHPTSRFFWLKCRQKWIDNQKVEIGNADGKPIAVNLNILAKAVKGDSAES